MPTFAFATTFLATAVCAFSPATVSAKALTFALLSSLTVAFGVAVALEAALTEPSLAFATSFDEAAADSVETCASLF